MAAKAFQKRGVEFRNRPSNALQPYGAGYSGFGSAGATVNPVPANRQGPGAPGYAPSQNNYYEGPTYTPFDGGGIYAPMPNYATPDYQGRATERLQQYSDFARQYINQLGNTEGFADPRDQEAINAEFAIRAKEAQLQQALIDGDLAEARRLQGEIAANKDILSNAVPASNASAIHEMDKALLFARQINERNAPPASIRTAGAMGDEIAAYAKGQGTTSDTASKIGAGEEALKAALSIAGADQDLFLQRELNRGGHIQKMIGYAEDVGVTGVNAIRSTFERQAMDDVAMDKQHWADEDRRIADIFKGLETKQAQLDLGKQRDALQKQNAQRALFEDVEFQGRNPFEVGVGAGVDYITSTMGDAPIHRVAYLHQQFEDMLTDPEFQEFQAAGDFSPQAVTAFLSKTREDADGFFTYADELGLTNNEIKILADAFGVYGTTAESYQFTARGVTDGSKGDESYSGYTFSNWTGSGRQAPNNAAFVDEAKAGEGPYGARANFAYQIAPQIADAYGLRADGAGYFRPVGAHEGDPNRSENSDHITAGAVDFWGTMQQMQQAAADLVNRPYVAGVRIHEPGPHLHVSFDINYFSS